MSRSASLSAEDVETLHELGALVVGATGVASTIWDNPLMRYFIAALTHGEYTPLAHGAMNNRIDVWEERVKRLANSKITLAAPQAVALAFDIYSAQAKSGQVMMSASYFSDNFTFCSMRLGGPTLDSGHKCLDVWNASLGGVFPHYFGALSCGRARPTAEECHQPG